MARPFWSLHAYHVLQVDEQLDLFGCREGWLHGVERQLALAQPIDRTLCGALLPSRPRWDVLDRKKLRGKEFCPRCRDAIAAQRRNAQPGWSNPVVVQAAVQEDQSLRLG